MKKTILIGLTFLSDLGSVFANNYITEQNPFLTPKIYGGSWCQVHGPTVPIRFFLGGPDQTIYSCQVKASFVDVNNNVTSCQTIDNQLVTIPISGRSNWMSYITSDLQNCLNAISNTAVFDVLIICTNQDDQSIIRAHLPSAVCTD